MRRQRCKYIDVVRTDGFAVDGSTLKYKILIGLREILEGLCDGGDITIYKCDGGRTDEKFIKTFDTCFTGSEASKRVFVNAVLGSVLAQRETKSGEVCDGETTVFSNDYSG